MCVCVCVRRKQRRAVRAVPIQHSKESGTNGRLTPFSPARQTAIVSAVQVLARRYNVALYVRTKTLAIGRLACVSPFTLLQMNLFACTQHKCTFECRLSHAVQCTAHFLTNGLITDVRDNVSKCSTERTDFSAFNFVPRVPRICVCVCVAQWFLKMEWLRNAIKIL